MGIVRFNCDMPANEINRLLFYSYVSILEIGAWEGDSTAAMLDAMPYATVVTFEADPRPLKKLVPRFADDRRVLVVPNAVGAVNDRVPWHASHGDIPSELSHGDWSLSSSLHAPTHHLERSPEISFSCNTTVPCVRLDDWVALTHLEQRKPPFDFAWIDVQGAQRDVIEGGRAVLDRIPLIYMEVHHQPEYADEPTAQEVCALLPQHEPVAIFAENILFQLK